MYFLNNSITETRKACSFQHSTEDNFAYYLIEKFYFPKRSSMVNMRDKIDKLSVFEEAVGFLIQIWLFKSQDITLQF
jgi:hypothetical protein